MNDNGYKVCYREEGRKRYKRLWNCNTYGGAEWTMQRCMREPPRAKDGKVLKKPTWKIIPITHRELQVIQGNCPFDFP